MSAVFVNSLKCQGQIETEMLKIQKIIMNKIKHQCLRNCHHVHF